MEIVKYGGFSDHLPERRVPRALILHGTGSGVGVEGDIGWWKIDKQRAVATPLIISRDGVITELFDLGYACYHTGVKGCNSSVLGIEIDNWNQLTIKDGRFLSWTGKELDPDDVIKLPKWRGYEYFEKISEKQKRAIVDACRYVVDRYPNIEYTITRDAVSNPKTFNAICTHSCIHPGKYDFHPLLPLW